VPCPLKKTAQNSSVVFLNDFLELLLYPQLTLNLLDPQLFLELVEEVLDDG